MEKVWVQKRPDITIWKSSGSISKGMYGDSKVCTNLLKGRGEPGTLNDNL